MKLLICGIAALLIYGCFSSSSGRNFNSSQTDLVKEGISNRADVLKILGEPNSKTITKESDNLQELWVYVYVNLRSSIGSAEMVSKSFSVGFDSLGIVTITSFSTQTSNSGAGK